MGIRVFSWNPMGKINKLKERINNKYYVKKWEVGDTNFFCFKLF